MVNVVCMKWGTRYGAEFVNRLRSMVRRQLNLRHRFICFTDDAAGIEEGIETLPLPPVNVPAGRERMFQKLGIFSNPIADLTGPVLWLDLDVVIVDRLDGFFEFPGTFCIIRDYRTDPQALRGNSSVFRFEAGAHPYVLEKFLADPVGAHTRFPSDQEFTSSLVRPLTFWPDEWCPSFREHCLERVPRCYFTTPRVSPGARVVIFHGHPKPADAARGCLVRGGLRYCRATPWVAEHWR
jgi:hypothetical protein